MKYLIAALLAAWLSIAPILVIRAQTLLFVSGKVNDQQQQLLPGATVKLTAATDSALIQATITDVEGRFSFNKLPTGQYKISAGMVGYNVYHTMFSLNTNLQLPVITLLPKETALKEVKITAQKPLVEQKIDRTIINVDAMLSNAGGTIFEALEKSPGIVLDQNGSIRLKGKGATVYIDDKPTYLSGTDLESYLRSLPASAIDQIELMTNPPAKYDAAGTGGIINIRTRKGKLKGMNGSVNLSYIQGRYARTNNSLNTNYRNGKMNVFGNLSYNTTNNYSDMDFYRHYLNGNGDLLSNFFQNSYTHRTGHSYGAKAGIDYYLSDKTTLGIGFTGLYHPSGQTIPVTSVFTNAQDRLDSTVIAANDQQAVYKNADINLNYRHQYRQTGRELTADIDYIIYKSSNNQAFNNNSYSPDGRLTNTYLLTGNLPTAIHIYTAKTDYTQLLVHGFNLSAGLKTSYTHTDNIANYFYTANQVSAPDYSKTNHFKYRENINAAYINTTKEFKRLSLQAGLRLENTLSNGHQLGNIRKTDSTFKRIYTNLFPTFYVQYKLDNPSVHQVGFNYGRRIERPYYQDLNPFLSPLDKFTYYTGNPFLKPAFTDAVELSHTYKNKITTTLSYSRTHDQLSETIEIVNGTYYSRPGNVGSAVYKSVSVDGSFDPAPWLNFHFYGEVTNIHTVSAFYTGTLDTKGTFFYTKPILQFKPGHDWTLQADGFYQTKVTTAQFIVGIQKRLNLAVSKKLSASTMLKLVVNDVFHSYVNSGIINNLALTRANYSSVGDTRTAVLSFSYRFGKAIANQRKHDATGAESEQNRIKN